MFLNVAYTWNTNKVKGKAAYIVGLKTNLMFQENNRN